MSTHTFTLADPARAEAILRACIEHGRAPVGVEPLTGDTLTLTFRPDLSPAEEAVLADIVAAYRTSLTLTEWQAIKDDVAGLKTYLGVASPTAAQTAAATKAIVRVLGTIIRS